MNLNDLYEMKDPRDAYQRDVDNSTSEFGKDSQAYRADGGANDENHSLDQQSSTWYIRLNGKLIKDKSGNPYSFQNKAAANKAARTMQAKLFNKDKEFMLTTNPNDKVAEGSQRVDSLVTKGLKLMRGPTRADAIAALKIQVGERDFNERPGFYNFYVRQLVDMYSQQGVTEAQQLSVQQLATVSDAALDKAYGYGRSQPGNSFGWQANLKSAAFAKQMIDKGVTDIEAISDAIHKGWNTTAQAFVQNPEQFDDTTKLKAAGKLEAKLQQRAQLMKQNYGQLPEEEKEKDRVVARALLQALKGEQGVMEGQRNKKRKLNEAMLMEDPVYRKFKRVGQYIAERKMSEKEILQVFADAETGMTDKGTGANRTTLGRGKDTTMDFAGGVADALKGVWGGIQKSVPVAAVDVAYDQATDALADLVGGQKGAVMQAIKKYRMLAKQYPKTAGLSKAALVAIAGLATGGAGLPAVAALVYGLDSSIKGDKLSDIALKAGGAAATAWAAGKIFGGPADVPADDGTTAGIQAQIDAQNALPVPGEGGGTYTIVKGDQLGYIAQANGSTVEAIRAANPDIDFSKALQPGQEINLPTSGTPGQGNVFQNYQGNMYGDKVPGQTADISQSVANTATSDAPINYTQAGPISTDSLGQKLEYGVPVNSKGDFIPPNPSLPADELAKQTAAYDTWKADFTKRFPNATQGADGVMQGIKPGLAPMYPSNYTPGMNTGGLIPKAVQESVKLIKLPANQLVDKKTTILNWKLNESTGRKSKTVNLTTVGAYTVFENIDRYRKAIMEKAGVPGSTRPEYYRPDMMDAPTKPDKKPGLIGRGLNALDRGVKKVGSALGTFGRQFTTNVTKEKLKMNWHQAGKPTDSDQLATWLTKQGVPQEVVTSVFSKMSIPYTVPAPAPTPRTISSTQPALTGGPTAGLPPATGRMAAQLGGQKPNTMANAPVSKTNVAKPGNPNAAAGAFSSMAGQLANTATTASTAGKFPGEDPTGPNYVGRLEVKRRQAARAAGNSTAKSTAPQATSTTAGAPSKVTYSGLLAPKKSAAPVTDFSKTGFSGYQTAKAKQPAKQPSMAEGDDDGRDKFYYQRNNIWRVMDGDELVHEYKPERNEIVGAKKLLARFDDEGYDVDRVISPMGVITYLYGKPDDDMDEGFMGNMVNKAKSMFTKPGQPAAAPVPAAPAPVVPDAATQARIAAAPQGYDPNTGKPQVTAKAAPGAVAKGGTMQMTKKVAPVAKPAAAAPAQGKVQGIKSNVDVNTLQKFNGIVDVTPKIKPQIKDAGGVTWTKTTAGWTDGKRSIDPKDSTYQSFDDAWRVANGAQPGNVGVPGAQQPVAEGYVDSDGYSMDHADSGEYDYEGDQARDQMNTIVRAARRLDGLLDDNENMPEWVQMKVTLAADYLDTAADYIESNQEPELEEGERGRGRPPSNTQDTTPVMPGRVEKTATGIRHHADASRYGGTEPDAEDDYLMSKSHISRLGKMTEPDIDEGWRETLGAAALTGAMALGAGGAQARVMPGDDPGINRLTGKPIATQQATDTAPTQSTSSINLAKPQAQYDVDTRILTYKGKQYKWNSDAQATGQGEVVTAPSMAVGSRSMGSTKVELNPNGTYTRAPANESQEKVGNMDADEFDSAMARLKQLAGAGPLKTVYDPAKRVYRNVPVAVQPKK